MELDVSDILYAERGTTYLTAAAQQNVTKAVHNCGMTRPVVAHNKSSDLRSQGAEGLYMSVKVGCDPDAGGFDLRPISTSSDFLREGIQ